MKVGFIGVGAMGIAMAGHVLQAGGNDVFAYDVDPQRVDAVARIGVTPVASLEEMGRTAEIFIVMVVNDQQALEVSRALANLGAEGLIAVTATIHPGAMEKIAGSVAKVDLRVIDAPVVFGQVGADQGRLVSLCGGAEEDVEAARPVMMAYGRAVYHVGPLGAGQMAKTVNNIISWAASLGNFEALLLAKRYGVEPGKLREILKDCPAQNSTMDRWDTSLFTWQEKDMDLALSLAQEGGLSLPFFGQVDQLIKLFSADRVRDLLYNDSVNYLDRTVGLGKLITSKNH